jgi:CRISPR-associated protein Cas2
MEGYGTRVQCPVFVSDLSDRELILLRGDLEGLVKHSEDSVMIVNLGQAGDCAQFLFLGQRETLPVSSAVII